MIIMRLTGGLGNQLFQYAFGLRMAEKLNTKLSLNCFDYGPKKYIALDRMRSYELNHFSITGKVASMPKLFLHRIGVLQKMNPVYEKSMLFDPEVLKSPDNSYFNGYWQSYKYFESIKPLVLKEFTFKEKPSAKNAELLKEITGTSAICIHIRRGDYVTDPLTVEVLGTRSLDYYYEAITHMVKRVKNPHFYVFSDDPEWVKQNLKLDYPATYIGHNQGKYAYEDLRLMSHCQHFIIANSTFSWWGAWLSAHENKIVIAPKQWFSDKSKDSRDLVPPTWIRL